MPLNSFLAAALWGSSHISESSTARSVYHEPSSFATATTISTAAATTTAATTTATKTTGTYHKICILPQHGNTAFL